MSNNNDTRKRPIGVLIEPELARLIELHGDTIYGMPRNCRARTVGRFLRIAAKKELLRHHPTLRNIDTVEWSEIPS